MAKKELINNEAQDFEEINAAKVAEPIARIDNALMGYKLHQTTTDTGTLTAHMDTLTENLGVKPQVLVADAGYGSDGPIHEIYLQPGAEDNIIIRCPHYTDVHLTLEKSLFRTLHYHFLTPMFQNSTFVTTCYMYANHLRQ